MNQVREIERSRQEAQKVVAEGMANVADALSEIQKKRQQRETEKEAFDAQVANKYEIDLARRISNKYNKVDIETINKYLIGDWEYKGDATFTTCQGKLTFYWNKDGKLSAKGELHFVFRWWNSKNMPTETVHATITDCDYTKKDSSSAPGYPYLTGEFSHNEQMNKLFNSYSRDKNGREIEFNTYSGRIKLRFNDGYAATVPGEFVKIK